MPDLDGFPNYSRTEQRLTIGGFVLLYLGLMSLMVLLGGDSEWLPRRELIVWGSLPGVAVGALLMIIGRFLGWHNDRRR